MLLYVYLRIVSFRVKVWVTCIVFCPMESFVLRGQLVEASDVINVPKCNKGPKCNKNLVLNVIRIGS